LNTIESSFAKLLGLNFELFFILKSNQTELNW